MNGDFEQGAIPTDLSQIERATGWTKIDGIGIWHSPDLMDARSTSTEVGVPANRWHSNLLDANVSLGKQRYAYISNELVNGVELTAEKITGTLTSLLPEGCYGFSIKAAKPSRGISVTATTNFVVVTLKSSTGSAPDKVIFDLSNNGSQNAIQQINWVAQSANFTISPFEAGKYDRIIVAMSKNLLGPNNVPNRLNAALVDEVTIFSRLQVATNLPDVVRICLGNELSLTPSITYNGLTSVNPNFGWSKAPGVFNHMNALNPPSAPFTLKDYPLENATYTFSGTDNGCFASKSVQVIVEDLVPANLQGSFTECDLEGVQAYALNNNLEGVDVSWMVVGGTLQLPPMTNPTFADVTWSTMPGIAKYIVVTQTSWSCSRTDTFRIYKCCESGPGGPDPDPDPDPDPESLRVRVTNTSHDAFFNNGSIDINDVSVVEINGSFEMDVASTIYSDITFLMGPGAKIIVSAALVEFNRCTFKACGDEMWDGIYVNQHQIDMNNCLIKESRTGVYMRNNALLRAQNSVFTKNYIAIQGTEIKLLGYGNPNPQSNIQLTNCTIKGNEGVALLAPYNQTITAGGITSYRNSHAGIVLHNAMEISIGDLSNPTNVNVFEGLNNGILARFAQVDVAHAVFKNIASNELHPQAQYPLLNGAAIRYNNVNTPYFSRDEQSKIVSCTFENCQFGVEGFFNDKMFVEYANFKSVNQGIKFVNPMNGLHIANNLIETEGAGVAIAAHATFTPPASIQANSLAYIRNNIITTRSVGIDVIALYTTVTENQISLDYHAPGTTFTGIRVRNIKQVNTGISEVSRNHVKVVGNLPSQQDVQTFTSLLRWNRGIAAEHCGYLRIRSNLIENTVSAMVLEGDLFANVELRCNTMADNYIGINRLNNTITQQGGPGDPADNKWIRIKGVGARVWESSTTTNFDMRYYHRGQTFGWNIYSPAPYTGPVLAFGGQNSSKDCEFLRPDGDEGGEENYVDLPQLEEVASGNMNFASLATDVKSYQEYYAAYKVIEAVKADSSLLSSSTLSAFYSQNQAELRNHLGDAHGALLAGDLAAYAQNVSSTTGIHVFDSLERVVAAIYARSWALPAEQPFAFDSADHAALYQIAHLDVLAGGEAVYTARVMLGIDPQPQMNLRHRGQNELRFVNDENIVVFPNPAQNDLRIALSDINEATYTYRILDINGRLMAQGSVQNYDGYGFINITTLPNGVYTLQIEGNQNLQRSKIVVMKP